MQREKKSKSNRCYLHHLNYMHDNRFHWQDGARTYPSHPLNFTNFEKYSEDRVYEMMEKSAGKGRK